MVRSRTLALLAALAVTAAACGSEPTAVRTPVAARHTLSATLLGSSQMRPGDVCLWEVFPSGGVAPYTYTYPDLDTGSDPTFYVSYGATGNYIFRVYVHDAQGSTTHVDQPVSVRSNYQSC